MPDGQRILSGAPCDNTVRVWLLDGTLENTFGLHTARPRRLVALPDNQHALSGSYDKTVKLFNVNDGAVLRTGTTPRRTYARLALLPDGLRFVSGSHDQTARHRLPHPSPCKSICLKPFPRLVARARVQPPPQRARPRPPRKSPARCPPPVRRCTSLGRRCRCSSAGAAILRTAPTAAAPRRARRAARSAANAALGAPAEARYPRRRAAPTAARRPPCQERREAAPVDAARAHDGVATARARGRAAPPTEPPPPPPSRCEPRHRSTAWPRPRINSSSDSTRHRLLCPSPRRVIDASRLAVAREL